MYNKDEQFTLLKAMGKKGLLLDHYDLEKAQPEHPYTSDDWRKLLQDPEVSLYIAQEFQMIRDTEIRKLQASASDAQKSVGAAQMINAMQSVAEKAEGRKEGPMFIYSFVPPSSEQIKAPNVRVIDYIEAQKLGLQPEEVPVTLDNQKIPKPEGDDSRWKETTS
jgi:hypothetical protein